MWLLDTEHGTFLHVDRPREHHYAILSHVWRSEGEQSFQDLRAIQAQVENEQKSGIRRHLSRIKAAVPSLGGSARAGTGTTPYTMAAASGGGAPGESAVLALASDKIRGCCALARRHGYRWAWIDSCCIDKTSSAALSEAINSMFEWYAAAGVCFALLEDVRGGAHDPRARDSAFRRARWWTRGWTLQELVAPREVVFVGREWGVVGTREGLAAVVEEVAGVERAVLVGARALEEVSVARRMAWAAKRQTTREEDRAYSLMGLFGVSMPTVYGEGARAFVRLQEEILKHVPDQSLFAWGPALADDAVLFRDVGPGAVADDSRYWQSRNLFAWSPDAFVNAAGVTAVPFEEFEGRTGVPFASSEYTHTNFGLRTRFPLIPIRRGEQETAAATTFLAVLACEDAEGRTLALLLYPQRGVAGRFYVGHYVGRPQVPPNAYFRLVSLSKEFGMARLQDAEVTDVCIPYRPSLQAGATPRTPEAPRTFKCPCDIVVPGWVVSAIEQAGFVVAVEVPRGSPTACGDGGLMLRLTETTSPTECALVLRSAEETIRIQIGRCVCLGAFLAVSVVGSVGTGSPRPTRAGTASSGATLVGAEDNKGRLSVAAPSSASASSASADRRGGGAASAAGGVEGPSEEGKGSGAKAPSCPGGHVALWEGGTKAFVRGERIVRLTFSAWLTRARVFSLTVELGTVWDGTIEANA